MQDWTYQKIYGCQKGERMFIFPLQVRKKQKCILRQGVEPCSTAHLQIWLFRCFLRSGYTSRYTSEEAMFLVTIAVDNQYKIGLHTSVFRLMCSISLTSSYSIGHSHKTCFRLLSLATFCFANKSTCIINRLWYTRFLVRHYCPELLALAIVLNQLWPI
jgi:hypothetical protein